MRWSWHEKPGPRKGPVIRHSDRLTPAQEEAKERERHKREHDYIIKREHVYRTEGTDHLYEHMRVCGWCGKEAEQHDMLWIPSDMPVGRWKCQECQNSDIPWRGHTEWLLDKPDPT
jgi:hypothetical protein